MLDLVAKTVERIVFSGVNGKVLIIPLIILIYVMARQAREFTSMVREIVKGE